MVSMWQDGIDIDMDVDVNADTDIDINMNMDTDIDIDVDIDIPTAMNIDTDIGIDNAWVTSGVFGNPTSKHNQTTATEYVTRIEAREAADAKMPRIPPKQC